MADDDNFDIDIYGDDQDYKDSVDNQDMGLADTAGTHGGSHANESTGAATNTDGAVKQDPSGGGAIGDSYHENGTQQISSTGASAHNQSFQKQAPQQQGVKRKQGEGDDRPTDPGATAALMINDLNWWISEEDIRGWANQSGCEDELNEITFNEHKVNGKSKGQVFVQLQTPQAATALKSQIEALYRDQAHAKKPSAIYNAPHVNPFKTLPKDVPQRDKNRGDRSSSGNFNNQGGQGGNYNNNRFNNNRGGFNNRAGGNMGYQNRNFSGPAGGNMGGGNFGGGPMGGGMNNFGGGPMGGGMNNFGGGFNRGGGMMGGMRGNMNNRGGRGGGMGMGNMGGNMGMPMGGNMMGMNPMGMMGGNMGMMGGMGVPGGFGGNQQAYNTGFYGQTQQGGGGDGWQNPHGAKRPRPE